MTQTIILETLSTEAQSVIERVLQSSGPVVIQRNGRSLGGMLAYTPIEIDLEEEERVEVVAAIEQGEQALAAGRYETLDDFKARHASTLQGE